MVDFVVAGVTLNAAREKLGMDAINDLGNNSGMGSHSRVNA